MKRFLLHLSYWFSYVLLCILIEYMWVTASLPDLSREQLLRGVLIVPVTTCIPEILFAYYVMYVAFDRFVRKKVPAWRVVLETLIVFSLAIIAVRLISYGVYNYMAYGGRLGDKNILDWRVVPRVVIFMGFSTGLAIALKFLRYQLVAKEREKNLLKENLSTELKLLRSQIHPHFLFNTLNNIYALTRKKSDQAPEAVMKLSELLSFILYDSNKGPIPIGRELHFLEDYIALEKIRYSERLRIEFKKDIANPEIPIAPLLLLPLVENAFKHGISETRFDSYIDIAVRQYGQNFEFSIENSIETDKPVNAEGKIGLSNIQRQLELMYTEHGIKIDHDNHLFRVRLSINLDSYGKV